MTDVMEQQINKMDSIVHASNLIDPEDRIINGALNSSRRFVRVSITRNTDLMVDDWLNIFESWTSQILLKSLDTHIPKDKDKPRGYYGTTMYEMDNCTVVLFLSSSNNAYFHFWSQDFTISDDWCRKIEAELFEYKAKEVFDAVTNTRDVTFWAQTGANYQPFNRKVQLLDWAESVDKNYPKSVLTQLEQLKHLTTPIEGGKIILLHGKPGTGKTSFLRSLSMHWTDWCHTSYITDPENFLGAAGAMIQVITWDYDQYISEDIPDGDGYMLLIIEDADELISADAKNRTSQGALARLLNIGDGLLGQSAKLLICITTNVDINNLHSAVSRAGRCLAQIEFDEFPYDEAVEWVKNHHPDMNPADVLKNKGYSLAELYEAVGKQKQIAHRIPEQVHGQYL